MYTLIAGEPAPVNYGTLFLVYGAFFVVVYLFFIKPQKKQQKQIQQMLSEMEVGDAVLTTGGFYGTIMDIQDEIIIVEFGNNKNCRIPMQKTAIAQIEKAASE